MSCARKWFGLRSGHKWIKDGLKQRHCELCGDEEEYGVVLSATHLCDFIVCWHPKGFGYYLGRKFIRTDEGDKISETVAKSGGF